MEFFDIKNFLGTDVREEELEEIRLLKADELLSAEAKEKIDELLKPVKGLNAFLSNLLGKLKESHKNIAQALFSSNDQTTEQFQAIIGKLSTSVKTKEGGSKGIFDAEKERLERMFNIAMRVLVLIADAEKKDKRKLPFLPVRGKKTLEKAISLEEKERKQINAKAHTLVVVFYMLLQAKRSLAVIVLTLQNAMKGYTSAKNALKDNPETEILWQVAANIKGIESSLRDAKSFIERLINSLETIQKLISNFRDYLNLAEGESKAALNYENAILKMFLIALKQRKG